MIVFRADEGRAITVNELKSLTGSFRYEVLGSERVPAEAHALHQRARQAGRSGDYAQAVTDLQRAVELAPDWPYPVYDLAFTYLLTGDRDNARLHYRKTLDLSPRGFYTAITAFDTLEREEADELPVGLYLAYLSLEWMTDPQAKADRVRRLTDVAPQFAPGWKELALLADSDDEKLACLKRGLAAKPDAETFGILTINRAILIERQGERDEAIRILGELAIDPASTFGTEHLARATLAMLMQPAMTND